MSMQMETLLYFLYFLKENSDTIIRDVIIIAVVHRNFSKDLKTIRK